MGSLSANNGSTGVFHDDACPLNASCIASGDIGVAVDIGVAIFEWPDGDTE